MSKLGTRYMGIAAATVVSLAMFTPSVMFGQAEPAGLSIVNYTLVSELRLTRSQWFTTYSASLMNTGPALPGVTATVTSLTPSIQVIPGQGILHFKPVPANGQTPSSETFTILVDRDAPFDFANLKWSFLNPVANAGANQTATVGSTVTLNGSASSNPSGAGTLAYSWALAAKPAGSNAVITNAQSVMASFTVDIPGNYIATLTVSNGPKSDSAATTVSTVNSQPVARAGPNQTTAIGATVFLSGSGSSDVDGDPLAYFWTLVSRPAGSSSFVAGFRSVSASLVIDKPGIYVVQLVVNDGKVDSFPSTVLITIGNTPPVANAGTGQVVGAGTLVQLNGSGSTDVDGDSLLYTWSLVTLPAGSTAHLNNTTAVNPTFTADLAGTYVAQLIVNDHTVDGAPSTVTITTNSVSTPTANPGPNQTVSHGATVNLSGSGSDPLGRPLTYSWSLITRPASSVAVLSNNSAQSPSFVADRPGNYVAQLIVNNGSMNSAPATVTVTTLNTPPVANAGSNQTVNPGATVILDASGSSDADHDSLTFSWSFMSRPLLSSAPLLAATSASSVFVADAAGTYVIQLIVNDGFTNSNPATVTITANPLQRVSFSPETLTLVGTSSQNLTLTLSGPAPPGGLTLNISSSNTGVATVPSATVTIPENTTTATVAVTGVAPGSAMIRASALTLADATANITVNAPAGIILPAPLTVAPGDSVPFPVRLANPAPADLYVQLTSSDSSTAALSTSGLNFNAGETQPTRQPTISGVAVGVATVTAAATGLGTVTSQVTVGLGVTLSPANLSIGASADGTLTLTLTGIAQNNITFALSSSNPGVATVPQVARLSPGMSVISFKVTGVSPGSTIIKASGLGFADVTANVTVQSPGSLSLSISAPVVQIGQTATVTISLSRPATVATTVSLTSGDTSRATVSPSSVVIPQGGSSGSVQVTGVNVGSSTIGASAQGYTATSTVAQIGATIAWVAPNVTITGTGQQIIVDLRLFAVVPGNSNFSILDGLAVNVTSSNPEVAITPSHVNFFWDGSTIPTVRVQVTSVRPGTTVLHASGTNIPDVTMTVTVNTLIAGPSGPVSASVASGSPQNAAINTMFANTLNVRVKDLSDNPVSGATVTFEAPATGPSGVFAGGVTTAVTDASGIATSPLFFANSTTGSYVVTARVGSLSTTFALTNTAPVQVASSELPMPVSVSPSSGTGSNQTFTFTFRHPGGVENLSVLNVLINKYLDGRQNCYLAYVPSGPAAGTLLLVNDGGDAGGPFSVLSLPGTGSVSNSQCTINGAGSSVAGSGDTLTLTLAINFRAGFLGDKVVYMAARDTSSHNSGWQALGVWEIPVTPQTGPVVVGVSPGRTNNTVNQSYTFTFSDSYGFMDMSVLNMLFNTFLDGRNSCYVAYVPTSATTGTVYLVNDAGDAGGPFQSMTIPGAGFVHNSQCTINAVGSSAAGSGTSLSITLAMSFTDRFAGNQVIYAAARSDRQTSDWHAKGTVTVLGAPWIGPALMNASFSPQSLTLASAETRNLTVTLSAPAPETGLRLSLFSTNPGVATVSPATVTIPANTTTASVQVTGVAGGAAVIRASAENTIAVNLTPAAANVTVNPAVVDILLPSPMTLQPGQIADYPISISAPAGPNGVFVILTSSDPTKVALSPNSGGSLILFFAPGSTVPDRRMPSLYAITYGSATISATGDGLQVVSQTVQVASTVSFSPPSLTLSGGQTQNLTLTLSGVTPPAGVTFNITSSNPAVAIVGSSTVTIPVNTTTATLRVTGGTGGSAVITASAVGQANMTATAGVTVNEAPANIVLPGPMTLQPGEVAPFPFRLSSPAGPGGVLVTLTSSDPTKVALTSTQGGSIAVFFPAGSTEPDRRPPDVYGINFGSATITASGQGLQPFSQTIQVTATLHFADSSFTTRMNGRENRLTLYLSAPAPASGLTVYLSSDDSTVASVPATTFIAAGSTTGNVSVTSVGVGSAIIHASALPYVPDAALPVSIIP